MVDVARNLTGVPFADFDTRTTGADVLEPVVCATSVFAFDAEAAVGLSNLSDTELASTTDERRLDVGTGGIASRALASEAAVGE